nr:AAA family ATPase [Methylobacterium sp.]
MNLAGKYRPRTFKAVQGQPHPVRFLSGLIQHGQAARSLLLHGAIGSGKTSLVRIYAQALNCETPTAEGSPCQTCEPCQTGVGFHEYDTSGRGGERETVLEWIHPRYLSPKGRGWTVLFFDEAQALEAKAADALLKMVEEPKPGVIFCFATTEFVKIRAALRSRLISFEIKPLCADEAITLLTDCACLEGIDHEPGALALLAGLRHGYPRDLLNGLEQVRVSNGGPVTIARVREVFDIDHTDRLLTYVQALATGDPGAQNAAWFSWNEAAAVKLDWLRTLFTGLYYNDVLGQTITVDALIASILPSERAPILAAFRERLGVASMGALAPYWRAMMARWSTAALDLDETALQLRVALFHHFVNDELPVLGLGRQVETRDRTPERAKVTSAPSAVEVQVVSHAPVGGPNRFPTIGDAHGVIESASYLMQEHGRLFNARLRIEPALFGLQEEAESVSLIAAFCLALEAQVERWSKGPFVRLSLIERDLARDGEVVGHILAHLPEPTGLGRSVDMVTRITTWACSWRREAWLPSCDAVVFETPATHGAKPLTFHWDSVLDLCAGVGEDAMDRDPVQEAPVRLLDLLEIARSRRRIVGGIAAPLVARSELLRPHAVEMACENGMPLLSALAARQWDRICSGWELQEHKDRQRTKAERAAALVRIAEDYGDTTEARARCEDLVASWQGPSEERLRRAWRGWWLPEEV